MAIKAEFVKHFIAVLRLNSRFL